MEVAERLQTALADTPFKFVDYHPPRNRLPQVIPFEYETTWPVEIRGQKLTILPPKPKAFTELGSRAWVLDLLRDVKTGRAVKEAQLPSGLVVYELLNGPCPPSLANFATDRGANTVPPARQE